MASVDEEIRESTSEGSEGQSSGSRPERSGSSVDVNSLAIPETEVEINHRVDLKYDKSVLADKDVRKRLVALEALNWWTESVAVLEGKLSRKTKRKDGLKNEIYQLVGLYSVFVGVVFSAVQSDRMQCRHIWIPIFLSLLIGFIIVYVINRKFLEVDSIRGDYKRDESARKTLSSYLLNLGFHGLKFNFRQHAKNIEPSDRREKFNEVLIRRGERNPRLVVLAVLAISTLVLVSSFVQILCFTPSRNSDGCITSLDWFSSSIGLRLITMATLTVEVINETDEEVTVMDKANPSVTLDLFNIPPKEKRTIGCTVPGTTGKQFAVRTRNVQREENVESGMKHQFTSEDFLTTEKIYIRKDTRKHLKVVCSDRQHLKELTESPNSWSFSGFWQCLRGYFW